jgi:hypothetical protein
MHPYASRFRPLPGWFTPLRRLAMLLQGRPPYSQIAPLSALINGSSWPSVIGGSTFSSHLFSSVTRQHRTSVGKGSSHGRLLDEEEPKIGSSSTSPFLAKDRNLGHWGQCKAIRLPASLLVSNVHDVRRWPEQTGFVHRTVMMQMSFGEIAVCDSLEPNQPEAVDTPIESGKVGKRVLVSSVSTMVLSEARGLFGWLAPPKFTQVQGADIVMESISLIDPDKALS